MEYAFFCEGMFHELIFTTFQETLAQAEAAGFDRIAETFWAYK